MKKLLTPFVLLLTSLPVFANDNAYDGFEFSAAGGTTWTHANNTTLTISPFEIDSVKTNSIANTTVWKVGVGYYFFQQQDQWWFREVLAELNVFRNPATLTGTVWQYQLAQFNNYTYSAPLTSTRLMFDIKPAFNFTNFFAYPILGVGVAWNNLAYHETVKPTGIPNSALSLSRNVRSNFAYEVGIGLGIDISPTITAKLEYLYAHIGKATPSSTSKNVALQSPPTFSLSSQVLMVGFSWQFAKEMP